MATLTVQGITDSLKEVAGSRGATDDQFRKELNLALPRLYNMGMWRDLLFEHVVTTSSTTFTIPDSAESIISAVLDPDSSTTDYSYPQAVKAQFYDYRLFGRDDDGDVMQAVGIVDDGYAPTITELVSSSDYTGYQISAYPVFPDVAVPTVSGSANVIINYDVLSGSKVENVNLNGGALTAGSDTDVQNVTQIRVASSDLTADVDIVAVPRGYTTDPTLTLSSTSLTQTDSDNPTVVTLSVTDASDVVVGDIIKLDSWPTSSPGGADANGEYRVTGVDTDNNKIYLYRSSDSETWTATGGSKVIHYPVRKLATLRQPDYITRYRRYRISNPTSQKAKLRLLLKRKFTELLNSTDVIYVSSLNAIKHAMLGNTAEDNADLERANYHWGICRVILDEQLDAHRGAAKPMVNFDPSGVGAYTSNML